jgi:hypothetical protein
MEKKINKKSTIWSNYSLEPLDEGLNMDMVCPQNHRQSFISAPKKSEASCHCLKLPNALFLWSPGKNLPCRTVPLALFSLAPYKALTQRGLKAMPGPPGQPL